MLEYNEGRIKQSLGWKTPKEYRMSALADMGWQRKPKKPTGVLVHSVRTLRWGEHAI